MPILLRRSSSCHSRARVWRARGIPDSEIEILRAPGKRTRENDTRRLWICNLIETESAADPGASQTGPLLSVDQHWRNEGWKLHFAARELSKARRRRCLHLSNQSCTGTRTVGPGPRLLLPRDLRIQRHRRPARKTACKTAHRERDDRAAPRVCEFLVHVETRAGLLSRSS